MSAGDAALRATMMCCASRPQTMEERARRRNAARITTTPEALVEERRASPRELRPLPLQLEPEPEVEPEPPQLEPQPVPLQPASPVQMPQPYSGPFTPGRGFMRYVRLLLAHIVLIVLLGGLAVQRGTVFSGQFPYSQRRAESSEEESDVLAWALTRLGLLATGGFRWELVVGWQRMFGGDMASWCVHPRCAIPGSFLYGTSTYPLTICPRVALGGCGRACIAAVAHIVVQIIGRLLGRCDPLSRSARVISLFCSYGLADGITCRVHCSNWLLYEPEGRQIAVGPQADTTVALGQLASRTNSKPTAGATLPMRRREHSAQLNPAPSGIAAPNKGSVGATGSTAKRFAGLQVAQQNWQRVLAAVMQKVAASQYRLGCVNDIGKPVPFANPYLEGEVYFRNSTSPHDNDQRYFQGKKRLVDFQFKLRYRYKPQGMIYVGFEGTGGTTPAWSWGVRIAVKIARKIVGIRHPEFIAEWGENITPVCMLAYDTFWDTFFVDRGQIADDGTGRHVYPDSPALAGPANPMPTNRNHKQILNGEAQIEVGTQFTMSFYSRATTFSAHTIVRGDIVLESLHSFILFPLDLQV
eukprot:COSAG02_NODE_35_length_49339_cov_20.375102_41_plen_583_part_00